MTNVVTIGNILFFKAIENLEQQVCLTSTSSSSVEIDSTSPNGRMDLLFNGGDISWIEATKESELLETSFSSVELEWIVSVVLKGNIELEAISIYLHFMALP